MSLNDDINRLLRDHTGYTGDGQGGRGALPVGDRSTALYDIRKRDLRELLKLIAQTVGDEGALQDILDNLSGLSGASAIALSNISGTANAITADFPSGVEMPSITIGSFFSLRAAGGNDGPVTLAVGDSGAIPLRDARGRELVGGDLGSSAPFIVRYSGGSSDRHWRLMDAVAWRDHVDVLARISGLGDDLRDEIEDTADALSKIEAPTFSGEFHGGDSEQVSAAIATADGTTLLAWDEHGRLIQPVDLEFYGTSDADDFSLAYVTEDGVVLQAWGADGQPISLVPDDGADPDDEPRATGVLGYVDGDDLRMVAADDTVAASLGDYNALAISHGSARSVRAVIDKPAIGATRSVTAGDGLLVPDAEKVLHVIIGLGQSLMVGAQSASTLVSVDPVFPDLALMFDREDGRADVRMGLVTQDGSGAPELTPSDLTGFAPLKAKPGQGSGGRGETAMESNAAELARQAQALGAAFRSLSFTAAMGGTSYGGLKKGSQTYDNMIAALNRAVSLVNDLGWKVIVEGCLVKHGEGDASSSSYLDNLLEWQQDIDGDVKAITGQQADVHFIMGQPSSHMTDTPRAIAAMLEAHNTSPVHHISGPDYPFGDAYHTDFLHFTGPGYFWIGEQMARAWKQALWSSKDKSEIVQIVAAARNGDTVVLDYEVPVPPLAIDNVLVTDRGQRGFQFFDGSTEIPISSVSVSGDRQITLTLETAPSGDGGRVAYAWQKQSSDRTAGNIPRGNVRDSAPDVSRHEDRPLYNWAVHQSLEL